MKTARHVLLALLFVGLTALEIAHGLFRLGAVRDSRHREILAEIELAHSELARDLRSKLEAEREHAAYLSRLPAVRRLLRAPPEATEEKRSLEADLLPYLVSFRGIDRVRILDPSGSERVRCERIGRAVGALPRCLLDARPDASVLSLIEGARAGEIFVSDVGIDSGRVEVSESDRQVLHVAAPTADGLGILVLTVYAAPLLDSVRRLGRISGVDSLLVARDGSYLASTDRARERWSPAATNLRIDYGAAAEAILSGANRVRTEDALFLALPTGEPSAPWRLVTHVPDRALDLAAGDLSAEYAWVIGSMVLTTLVLVSAGAFLIRMSVREFRLREIARYEKQQKELERRMRHAERLGSLGLLTAGVAHEINNPLEGIENYLALLERDPLPDDRRKRYVEMVRYGFRRIRDIVRDLSAFAKPAVGGGAADLGEVVRHALRMVGYTKGFQGVQVVVEGLGAPCLVAGDAGRLEQVFINLLLNASKAMGGRGTVRISARMLQERAGGPRQVEVAVEDTGPGIPEDALDKIFDPFFTTTDGTGLGLSVSYGIVSAHGGTIGAENRPEGGARFTVRLRAAEEPASALRQKEETS
ncbi:MAG: sensor histidine kinase [Planctomycetota bacterium]